MPLEAPFRSVPFESEPGLTASQMDHTPLLVGFSALPLQSKGIVFVGARYKYIMCKNRKSKGFVSRT